MASPRKCIRYNIWCSSFLMGLQPSVDGHFQSPVWCQYQRRKNQVCHGACAFLFVDPIFHCFSLIGIAIWEKKRINYLKKKRSVNKSSSYFACTMSKIPLPQQMARPPEGVLRLGCAPLEHNSWRQSCVEIQKLCSNKGAEWSEDKFW